MRRDFSLNQVIAVNKIYRVVWNAETGQWVVASEMAKGRKKKSSSGSNARVVAVSLLAGVAGLSGQAFAGSFESCAGNGAQMGGNRAVATGRRQSSALAQKVSALAAPVP